MSNAANTVQLNGQDFVLLPLNWKKLKELREEVIIINNLKPQLFSPEEQDAILKVVTASLQRSRPDISEDFVAEHLDLGNVGDIIKMVFGDKSAKKDAGTGEAQAATSQT